MKNKRRKTRQVKVGNLILGSGNPVYVQSMTNTDTRDWKKTLRQIKKLEDLGCSIVRVAVVNMDAAKVLGKIKKSINIPLVADIHFNWKLAVEAAKQGVDKIRINPGNIGDKKGVKEIVKICKDRNIAIRVGVNSGSLKAIKQFDTSNWTPKRWAQQMVKEAMREVEILEEMDFKNIVVSLKADDIERTILANEIFAEKTDIPLHLGVTEAGTLISGIVKSSIALSSLLSKGIGDTIRVSLTEDPIYEIRVAYEILKSLGLAEYGPDIISCPTCGRCEVDLINLVHRLEEKIYSNRELLEKSKGLKIAVMGCVVNGPGEAKEADFGICGGKKQGVFIEKGKQQKVLKEKQWLNYIINRIKQNQGV